jgi:Mg-chelatase subunit ChlD
MRTGGSTALVDTIYLALSQLRELQAGPKNRSALLIVSDGMDNHSRYSKAELMRAASESDAPVYTMAIAPVQRDGSIQPACCLEGPRLGASNGSMTPPTW